MTPADERRWRDLAESIRAELRMLNQQIEAIREQTNSSDKSHDPEPKNVVISEFRLPVAVEKHYSAEQYERPTQARWRWIRLSVEGLALLTAIGLAILTRQTLKEISRQSDAAIRAARATEKAVEATIKANLTTRDNFRQDQRPYLWITNATQSVPHFVPNRLNPSTGQIVWTWHYTNYGRAPAYNVRHAHEIRIGDSPFVRSYGSSDEGAPGPGPPIPPGKDDFATVISAPGLTPSEYARIISPNNLGHGISMRARISYSDAYDGKYETIICLDRLNSGAITYCPESDIK